MKNPKSDCEGLFFGLYLCDLWFELPQSKILCTPLFGGKDPDSGTSFLIFGKNNYFNAISITFRTFSEHLKELDFQSLKDKGKKLNCSFLPLFTRKFLKKV